MPIANKIMDIPISAEFLWFALAILIVFFLVMSMILSYHWKNYGVDNNPKIFARAVFWVVSVILIVVMAFAATGFDYL